MSFFPLSFAAQIINNSVVIKGNLSLTTGATTLAHGATNTVALDASGSSAAHVMQSAASGATNHAALNLVTSGAATGLNITATGTGPQAKGTRWTIYANDDIGTSASIRITLTLNVGSTATLGGLVLPNATDDYVWTEYGAGHGRWAAPTGITQTAADARYLKLAADNDPLTGQLDSSSDGVFQGKLVSNVDGEGFWAQGSDAVTIYGGDELDASGSADPYNILATEVDFDNPIHISGGYDQIVIGGPTDGSLAYIQQGDGQIDIVAKSGESIALGSYDSQGALVVQPALVMANQAFQSQDRIIHVDRTTNPSTSAVTTDTMVSYRKGTKFVIAYNDAGTMRYTSIDMNGTLGVTGWTLLGTGAP